LNIRKPVRFVGRVGQALQLEDLTETSVPLTLTTQRGVDFVVTTQDLALSIDDFSERFVVPNIANVANFIDFDGMSQYINVYNEIGTPGTIPNAALTYLQAGQRLDEEAAPRDNLRALVISPAMQAVIIDTLKGLFHSADRIEEQYEKGTIGLGLGFKWSMDQNCRTQTVGAQGGTPVVNAANQTGNSITSSGWSNSTQVLNAGDVITFASVFAVNPQSKQSTGYLRQFVVTQNVTSNGSGVATIPIQGPGGLGIVTAGPFQTVTASPANNASITVNGAGGTTSSRGLAFHRDAFTAAFADLPLVGGVDMCGRVSDKQLGVSLRVVRAYDINMDRLPLRSDVLYGWQTIYPELACRVTA
jgi:hypothetical protein